MALGGIIVMWPAAERHRAQSGYAAVMRPSSIVDALPEPMGVLGVVGLGAMRLLRRHRRRTK